MEKEAVAALHRTMRVLREELEEREATIRRLRRRKGSKKRDSVLPFTSEPQLCGKAKSPPWRASFDLPSKCVGSYGKAPPKQQLPLSRPCHRAARRQHDLRPGATMISVTKKQRHERHAFWRAAFCF